ncbi:hypothetical protein F2P79_025645 [Pimephales promelas]|nr:hypothetical protein F2P79_025645 [Pimephales promelas]
MLLWSSSCASSQPEDSYCRPPHRGSDIRQHMVDCHASRAKWTPTPLLSVRSQTPACPATKRTEIPQPKVQSWTAADSALGTSTVINHTLTLDIHAAQEARKCKPPQPPRDPQEEGTTLETASNLSKLSPYLSLAAACHLTLMIHLPSVHCDGVVR